MQAGAGDFEMADVARAAGVSEGLAYHYYKSEAGLTAAVIEDFYGRYSAVANVRMDPTEPWGARERRRLGAVIAFLYADPLAPVILGSLSVTPAAAAVQAAQSRSMAILASGNIRNGVEQGVLAADIDPDIAGPAVIGSIWTAFVHAFATDPRPTQEALSQQLWALIAGAVRLDQDGASFSTTGAKPRSVPISRSQNLK